MSGAFNSKQAQQDAALAKAHSAAHPGFKAEEHAIAEREHLPEERAGAILAAAGRKSSNKAREHNKHLNEIGGMPPMKKKRKKKTEEEPSKLMKSVSGIRDRVAGEALDKAIVHVKAHTSHTKSGKTVQVHEHSASVDKKGMAEGIAKLEAKAKKKPAPHDETAAHDFSRQTLSGLSKNGVRLTGIQSIPDENGSWLNPSRSYKVDDNGTGRVLRHHEVKAASEVRKEEKKPRAGNSLRSLSDREMIERAHASADPKDYAELSRRDIGAMTPHSNGHIVYKRGDRAYKHGDEILASGKPGGPVSHADDPNSYAAELNRQRPKGDDLAKSYQNRSDEDFAKCYHESWNKVDAGQDAPDHEALLGEAERRGIATHEEGDHYVYKKGDREIARHKKGLAPFDGETFKKSLGELKRETHRVGGASDHTPSALRKGFESAHEPIELAKSFAKGGHDSYVYYGGDRFHMTVDHPPAQTHHEGRGFVAFERGQSPVTHYYQDGRRVQTPFAPQHLGIQG